MGAVYKLITSVIFHDYVHINSVWSFFISLNSYEPKMIFPYKWKLAQNLGDACKRIDLRKN